MGELALLSTLTVRLALRVQFRASLLLSTTPRSAPFFRLSEFRPPTVLTRLLGHAQTLVQLRPS